MESKWFKHDNNGMPPNINRETVVVVEMINGDILSPMKAGIIGWTHPDAVVRYSIKEKS